MLASEHFSFLTKTIKMKKIFLFAASTLVMLYSLAQTKDTLTNENIIQLSQMGLQPEIIILKIKNSYTRFDVSTTNLVKLTNSKVSTEVIGEMIKTANSGKDLNEVAVSNTNPNVMHPAGIYYYNAADTSFPLKKVDPASASYESGGGGYGGFGGHSTAAVISGEESKIKIAERNPVFYFYFSPSAFRNIDWFDSSSPNDFTLVKFDVKRGKRSFKVGSSSSQGFSSSSREGIPAKFKIPFDYVQIGEGIYKITFKKALDKGDYCFAFETNTRKLFDFKILK